MLHRNWLTAGAVCVAMAFVIAAAVYFYSQRPTSADGQAMILPVDPTPLVAVTKSGERSFSIEIADTSDEREAGLMFRQQMADDHGMLFVFEESRDLTFWMKNTPMPLDLIFVGQDGRIRAILHGEPQSEAIISPGEPVRFVLELKAGTAAKDGIADGDLLRHPAIGTASGPARPAPDKGDAPSVDPN
ncbi:MAG: DUF192 domain-containing protein [Mesorhizobium sp.]|uniref:DUF192 domain-containing protein n=4 Tax=Mesorhizobium TaxID=68287 RepID=UPI000F75D370|nr:MULTISPECIES: DUF192 domain-containing protein [unclassified Mesorhizobium]AZO46855.1 DUF192 domain-containing protein [Mesorhizobium sp. M4B.F.Ca.ET.058.02.1.1]RVC42771.1 DUF192 domain-containing protein [Mesorhizobium sp. M4A.F.Ca.ET.090.04.2.1]RVC75640.1 DUF192 domain-containing protein [Mesorhizobium sp. M4A.F.Ca.ET.022.05.2.1]RWC16816.1 MAG: DUF192 domain-containing protein [Mesorhizobium sp.]RWC52520.1 MAG: DUF192 domain-containing protein [Mesorhizobium sp.]